MCNDKAHAHNVKKRFQENSDPLPGVSMFSLALLLNASRVSPQTSVVIIGLTDLCLGGPFCQNPGGINVDRGSMASRLWQLVKHRTYQEPGSSATKWDAAIISVVITPVLSQPWIVNRTAFSCQRDTRQVQSYPRLYSASLSGGKRKGESTGGSKVGS